MALFMGMSDAQWAEAAERFGLTPEELADYKDAFDDVALLGLDGYLDVVLGDAVRAVTAARAGHPPDAATLRRMQARKTVAVELVGANAVQQALAKFDGPRQ